MQIGEEHDCCTVLNAVIQYTRRLR